MTSIHPRRPAPLPPRIPHRALLAARLRALLAAPLRAPLARLRALLPALGRALLLASAAASPLAAQTTHVAVAGGGGGRPPAAAAAERVVTASRVAGAIALDGRLDEAAWDAAAATSSHFVQLRPRPGEPASQRTEVRVLYDDEAIYVGARMYDTAPDSIVARLGRRDDHPQSDWFTLALDSYDDHRTAFVFAVNPKGVLFDEFIYNDTQEDASWDAVWEAKAAVDSLGWTAELRIPFSQLRYDANGAGPTRWGIEFQRDLSRRGEQSFWAPIDPSSSKLVSAFGTLRGLGRLRSPRHLEIQPYTLAKLERQPGDAADPFHRANDFSGGVGADLKYGLTSNLTLTATINPDFGQVEADPSVVNLSAYESYFPEKRPFFVEGADIFNFGIGLGDGDLGNESLFYTRRIGAAPHGDLPDDAAYGTVPAATPIIGAAKVSGKTPSGWSMGFMDAVTARQTAPYALDGGARGSAAVEPLTNYAVGRIIRDFRQGQSAIGGIFTATNRNLDAARLDFLNRSAYTGGADFRHRWGGGDYQVSGFLIGSVVRGSTDAITRVQEAPGRYFQRPDADYVTFDSTRTSLAGTAAQVQVGKIGGGNWVWLAALHMISPGFEVNDVGFQTQHDLIENVGYVGYQQFQPRAPFRRWRVNVNGWHGYDFGGDLTSLGGNVNANFDLVSFWSGYGGVGFNGAVLSTDALRGGPALRTTNRMNAFGGVGTDSRRALRLGIDGDAGLDLENDGHSFGVYPSLSWRASSQLDLSFRPSVRWNRNDAQYVTQEDFAGRTHYYFGRIDQTTVSFTTRLGYTFTPDLSLQLYAQPFVSAGAYSDFREVVAPRAHAFGDRFHTLRPDEIRYDADAEQYLVAAGGTPDAVAFDRPDFDFKQLRSTAVLRWEYRPGSTLFVVWSQGRTGSSSDGTLRFGRDFGSLFGNDPGGEISGENVLLVKLTYWLGT